MGGVGSPPGNGGHGAGNGDSGNNLFRSSSLDSLGGGGGHLGFGRGGNHGNHSSSPSGSPGRKKSAVSPELGAMSLSSNKKEGSSSSGFSFKDRLKRVLSLGTGGLKIGNKGGAKTGVSSSSSSPSFPVGSTSPGFESRERQASLMSNSIGSPKIDSNVAEKIAERHFLHRSDSIKSIGGNNIGQGSLVLRAPPAGVHGGGGDHGSSHSGGGGSRNKDFYKRGLSRKASAAGSDGGVFIL